MFNRVAALPLLLIRSPLLHMVYYLKPPEQDGRVRACQYEYVLSNWTRYRRLCQHKCKWVEGGMMIRFVFSLLFCAVLSAKDETPLSAGRAS